MHQRQWPSGKAGRAGTPVSARGRTVREFPALFESFRAAARCAHLHLRRDPGQNTVPDRPLTHGTPFQRRGGRIKISRASPLETAAWRVAQKFARQCVGIHRRTRPDDEPLRTTQWIKCEYGDIRFAFRVRDEGKLFGVARRLRAVAHLPCTGIGMDTVQHPSPARAGASGRTVRSRDARRCAFFA